MESGDNILLSSEERQPRTRKFFRALFSQKTLLTISIILIVIILVVFLWIFVIDKYEGCRSWECFNENLVACSETRFAGGKDVVFGYTIQGGERTQGNDVCVVDVEFLQGEIENRDQRRLIGQKMTCSLPRGIVMLPESDLERCSGPLKEQLQEQIIEQLHNFIIQNLGQINKELLNPLNYQ